MTLEFVLLRLRSLIVVQDVDIVLSLYVCIVTVSRVLHLLLYIHYVLQSLLEADDLSGVCIPGMHGSCLLLSSRRVQDAYWR